MPARSAIVVVIVGAALCLGAGCDPYGHWPDPEQTFPHVYTPQSDLQPWDDARWETETWDPVTDSKTAGLYLKKLLYPRKGAPTEALRHFELMRPQIPKLASGSGAGPRLSFVGDVMWVGGNWKDYTKRAHKLLDGDLRVGNLETPTSPDHPTESMKLGLYAFNAPVELLADLPLDLLQLNNNHSLDAGDKGLENTLREVKTAGYQQVGVDAQVGVGARAALEVKGREIAVLAYTWGLNNGARSKKGHQLHIIPFGHLDEAVDLSLLTGQVAKARGGGGERLVVVLVHWGFEYEWYPDPHFMVLARRIVAAGADLVLGHGPHVVQPAELCHVNRPEHAPGVGTCSVRSTDGDDRPRTAFVLYSLGNFGTMQPLTSHRVGLVATVQLGAGTGGGERITGLGWSAVVSRSLKSAGKTGEELLPLSELLGEAIYADEDKRLERHLGRHWKR